MERDAVSTLLYSDSRAVAVLRALTMALLGVALMMWSRSTPAAPVGDAGAIAQQEHTLDLASAWLVSSAFADDSPAETGDVAFCSRVASVRVDCAERYPNDGETGDHCAVVDVLRLERSGRLSTGHYNCPTPEPPFTPARDILVHPPGGLQFVPLTPVAFGYLDERRLLGDHAYAHSIPTPYGRARWLGRHPNPPLAEWLGRVAAAEGGAVVLHAIGDVFVGPSYVEVIAICNSDSETAESIRLSGIHIHRDRTFSDQGYLYSGNVGRFSLRGRFGPWRRKVSGSVRFRERNCRLRANWSARRTR